MNVASGAVRTGLNGAGIDGSVSVDVTNFAKQTPWLHGIASAYTNYGFVLFAVLLVLAWWAARQKSARAMAAALWSPFAVVLAYAISNYILKGPIGELRPCRAIPHLYTVSSCDPVNDFAFPSNHSVLAAAFAVAILLVHRGIGSIVVLLALLMGLSRLYVGAHYLHDVLGGYVIGALVACTGFLAMRLLAGPIERIRAGGHLRWLLGGTPSTTAPVAAH